MINLVLLAGSAGLGFFQGLFFNEKKQEVQEGASSNLNITKISFYTVVGLALSWGVLKVLKAFKELR